jgi:pseudaminic acid cytidylyltransferase
MGNLAIIPARGGSKRIPRKNIKCFLGEPIIAYSIKMALKSGLFEEIMVSTDDQEIADIAIKYGAKVPFLRSKANADDFATTRSVLKEVELFYNNQNRNFDYVCCIYPTAPLVNTERLKEGLSLMIANDLYSVIPIVEFSYPIWRGLKIDNGLIKMAWPDFANSRSQDLEKIYHDAGQWYWYNPKKLKDNLFTSLTGTVLLSELEVQDIDTQTDWDIAEMKFKLMNA